MLFKILYIHPNQKSRFSASHATMYENFNGKLEDYSAHSWLEGSEAQKNTEVDVGEHIPTLTT